jgi:sugar (pentulose or hexulose) kinase
MKRVLLGVDIGTKATKAILADVEGSVRAETSAPICLSSPRPGWAEEDPESLYPVLKEQHHALAGFGAAKEDL